jgi:hypothetical protein
MLAELSEVAEVDCRLADSVHLGIQFERGPRMSAIAFVSVKI